MNGKRRRFFSSKLGEYSKLAKEECLERRKKGEKREKGESRCSIRKGRKRLMKVILLFLWSGTRISCPPNNFLLSLPLPFSCSLSPLLSLPISFSCSLSPLLFPSSIVTLRERERESESLTAPSSFTPIGRTFWLRNYEEWFPRGKHDFFLSLFL